MSAINGEGCQTILARDKNQRLNFVHRILTKYLRSEGYGQKLRGFVPDAKRATRVADIRQFAGRR